MNKKYNFKAPPLCGLSNDYSLIEYIKNSYWAEEKVSPTLPVSIIIPVYNRREILAKTIAGIIHQDYPLELIQVIIADDGSNDNPESIIPLFKGIIDIKYISQDDRGFRASAVRNLGVSIADHDNLIFLDCDMLPEPSLVSSFMKWLHVSKEVVLIGRRRFVNTDGIPAKKLIKSIDAALNLPDINSENKIVSKGSSGFTIDWREQIYSETNNLKDAGPHVFRTFCSGNVAFAKSAWDKIGGFDEDFNNWGGEDTEFGFRAYNQGLWFIPVIEAVALHQEPPGGDNETDRIEGSLITHKILVEKCPSRYRKYEAGRNYEIPKVSVFMPACNCEKFIEEAVNCILNQSYCDLELLITDDGGTDKTASIIKKLARKDSRIRFFPKKNGGIGSACNHMLANARGEYVLQIDGDDVLSPDAVESLVEVLDNNDVGFVYGDAFLVNRDLEFIRKSYSWSVFDRDKMLTGGMHIHPPRMFRLRDFRRTSGYDEVLENAVDYDFFLKLSEISDGYHLQKSLYLYRKHGKNTSDIKTQAQTTNSQIAISNSITRMGIFNAVGMEAFEDNPRRMKLWLLEENPKLDPMETIRKYKLINNTGKYISSLGLRDLGDHLTIKNLNRSSIICENSNKRRAILIGPFENPLKLIQAENEIKQSRSWLMSYIAVGPNPNPAFLLKTGLFPNEKSAQAANDYLRLNGFFTEIIAHGSDYQFYYPATTRVDLLTEMVEASRTPSNDYLPIQKRLGEPQFDDFDYSVPQGEIENYRPEKRWNFESGRLFLNFQGLELWFDMPEGWKFDETHPDLFRLAEYVLLSPLDDKILDNWNPTRKAGSRPGLAFSAGVDSTAAMSLMPDRTLLFYHERSGFDTVLKHDNAHLFINYLRNVEGRPVIKVKSNHELIRTLTDKQPGFITDYACAVHVILLADFYDLDSIGTGMPLENSFLFHGQKFREFDQSWFWKLFQPLFSSIGLPIYQPVMGCSEYINRLIVEKNGYGNLAQSCLRAGKGRTCEKCWKCFRKNTIIGGNFTMSTEIESFLKKQPLKMAASTIHTLKKVQSRGLIEDILEKHSHLQPLMELDVSFLDGFYPPALDLLPKKYREYTENRLRLFIPEMPNRELLELFDVSIKI
jgi:chondroitin synthase